MRKLGLSLFLVIVQLVLIIPVGARGETVANMRGYCNVPALAGFGVKPNLLLLLDNSASMYDPAYTDSSKYCLDDTADTYSESSEPYLGYFNPTSFYQYVFRADARGNEAGNFEPASGASMQTATCNRVFKEYLCVNVDAQGKVTNFVASGNFLNWLTMSKLDIEKMALTGGKYDPATMMLQGETRGCQGKRFIKMVGDAGVTFAVRGPVPAEEDYLYQASQGGMTRIEIYAKRYNKDACLAAVNAWQSGKADDLGTQTALCMDDPFDPIDGETPSKGKVYTEIMSACYSYLAGESGVFGSDSKVFMDLIADCQTRIMFIYNDSSELITRNEGDLICGKAVYHRVTKHGGREWSHGYFGMEYVPGWGFPENTQVLAEHAQDYCSEVTNPSLTDPSTVALKSGTNANVPSFVLESGVYSLGEIAGTMIGRVRQTAQPAGVIQEFENDINFGAMIFNNGSGSECGGTGEIVCPSHCAGAPPQKQCYQNSDCGAGGNCTPDPSTDGGAVISYLNHSPVGNHNKGTGLVSAIDQIRGDSWTPLSEAFYDAIGYFANRGDLRLSNAAFDTAFPPSKFSCQKNTILMVSDGMSTADRAQPVLDLVARAQSDWMNGDRTMPPSQTTTDPAASSPSYSGSYNLDDLAWIARNKNISSLASPIANDRDYISTYVIYTGTPCDVRNADGSCATSDERVPEKLMQLTASKGGGKIFSAQKPKELVNALRNLLQMVGSGSNSTTDASFLSTGQGNGALFVQEQFYRNKSFDGGVTSASWIGEMQGLWYFIDSFIASNGGASAIREDTGELKILDLKRDRVVRYVYDSTLKQTSARLYLDSNGDGAADATQPSGYPLDVAPEAVQSLWRAGVQLWQRDPATRTIYTHTDGINLVGLSSNGSPLQVLNLSVGANQKLLQAANQSEAAGIVSFVQGSDNLPATRDRGVNVNGSSTPRVWKLGDIVSSTPVLQSAVALGNYNLPAPRGYSDASYQKFTDAGAYGRRGTAYVGANDGMLHAFRIGVLKQHPDGEESWPATQKAVLTGSGIGEENWAFIPKNALPYLRYLKEPLYPHLYYVDGVSTIADVSIGDPDRCSPADYWNCSKDLTSGTNWRTVLIGGMGLGGASRNPDDDCREGKNGTCVRAPQAGAGLSSYFALDVTGQSSDTTTPPRLLWEFSHPALGYATSGAAIIKINAQGTGSSPMGDRDRNGRWFAVFASGPTGPIDKDNCQFLGASNQTLKLFVVDINATPPLVERNNYWVIDTRITNAFGGSMYRAGIDADRWNPSPSSSGHYQDEALYLGYTRLAEGGSWTGGVLRLLTNESLDPGSWKVSKVIDGIGPVTGGVAKLQDRKNHKLWLYFGTGRFYYNQDDLTATSALFGVQEPCYTSGDALADDGRCSASSLRLSDLTDMTGNAAPEADSQGWWIGLDRDAGGLGSERFIANPSVLSSGAVYFTSFKPALDVCQQGLSYLWGVKYDTGGTIVAPLMGTALVPLSNGNSAEFPITGLSERGNRRSPGMPGKPGGVKLISNSGLKPLKKIIHIQER